MILTLLLSFLLCLCSQGFISSPRGKARFGKNLVMVMRWQTRPEAPLGGIKMPVSTNALYWPLHKVAFSLLPLAPGPRRKTLMATIVPGKVWSFDQIQGVVNVNVPVRGVAVKLKAGGLLLYNPVAPTQEMLSFVMQLEADHGPVKHIVLGSLGLEHKALAGPFSQYFPSAQVWQQPGQWSFPVNLPSQFYGFPLRVQDIPTDGTNPWREDFDIAVLEPLRFKSVGGFGETAMFHRETKTLLVTDAVIRVPSTAPPIIAEDPRALLFHSRDEMLEEVKDTEAARQRGWRRMALFGLFFYPSGITVSGLFESLDKLKRLPPGAETLGLGALPIAGLYPWSWTKSEEPSFRAVQGSLLVAPILRKLILNREPQKVLDWVERVSRWDFKRIIPAHFENNVPANGKDFKLAYSFLAGGAGDRPAARSLARPLAQDNALLNSLSDIFTKLGVVARPLVEEA